MCAILRGVNVLGVYSCKIALCINLDKIGGLKSHDWYVLMHQWILIVVHNVGLPKQMTDAIIEL